MKNLGLAVVEVVPDGDVPDSMYDNLVDNVGMWRGVFMLPPAEMRELGLTGQIMAAMAYEIDDNEEDVNCAADMLGETWTYVYNTRTLYVRLKGVTEMTTKDQTTYNDIVCALNSHISDSEIAEVICYKPDNTIDYAETERSKATERERRRRGQEILKTKRLRFSQRRVTPLLEREDSILVEAGFIANSPAYREVWLEPRPPE